MEIRNKIVVEFAMSNHSKFQLVHDLLLIFSGFLLGIGLMIVDELFMIVTKFGKDERYYFPFLGYLSIWTSWEISFIWIIVSIFILVLASRG